LLIGGALVVLIIIGGTIALVVTLIVKASKPKPHMAYGNQQYGNRPVQYPNQFGNRPPSNPNHFR